jgi:hypothetical protein
MPRRHGEWPGHRWNSHASPQAQCWPEWKRAGQVGLHRAQPPVGRANDPVPRSGVSTSCQAENATMPPALFKDRAICRMPTQGGCSGTSPPGLVGSPALGLEPASVAHAPDQDTRACDLVAGAPRFKRECAPPHTRVLQRGTPGSGVGRMCSTTQRCSARSGFLQTSVRDPPRQRVRPAGLWRHGTTGRIARLAAGSSNHRVVLVPAVPSLKPDIAFVETGAWAGLSVPPGALLTTGHSARGRTSMIQRGAPHDSAGRSRGRTGGRCDSSGWTR